MHVTRGSHQVGMGFTRCRGWDTHDEVVCVEGFPSAIDQPAHEKQAHGMERPIRASCPLVVHAEHLIAG